jgi:predicted nuclease of predicted toxin-antitoxin system
MKLLFDQNLSHRLCGELEDVFSDSAHVRPLGLAEADDRAIWEFARLHGFTIVSLDADFADMAVFYAPPPKVIWLRAGNQPTAAVAALLRSHASAILDFARESRSVCLELY